MRLDPELHAHATQILREHFNANRTIESAQPVSGGCISTAYRLWLDDGTCVFLKFGSQPSDMFGAEADGLAAIAATQTVTVPTVMGVGKGTHPFIMLSWIETEPPSSQFWRRLGLELAALHTFHRETNSGKKVYGFHRDNFIGAMPQRNTQTASWSRFFAEHRIEFQTRLALQQNRINEAQFRLIQDALPAMLKVIQQCEDNTLPSLIHGDLWRGNVVCGAGQKPWLIDPAVHLAHHESELAMTRLFGGFADAFQTAYDERVEPLAGREHRVEIYQLYHLLNHVNLFGSAYWPDCQRIASQYL